MKAEGTGKGTMTVVTVYNAKVPDKENKCDNFDLQVQVEDVRTGESPPRPRHVLYVDPPCPPLPSPPHGTPCLLPHPLCPLIVPMSPHRQGTGGCLPLRQDHHLRQVGQAGDIGTSGTLEMGRGTGILGTGTLGKGGH